MVVHGITKSQTRLSDSLVPVPGESGPDTFTCPVLHLLRAISANLMNYSGPMCSPSRGILEASPFHKYLDNWQVI